LSAEHQEKRKKRKEKNGEMFSDYGKGSFMVPLISPFVMRP
jgi:hypothetical protein